MEELLQHLMAHPSLVKGVGLGARSKETIDREWNNLATKLNAHGNGATKTGQRWKRYWADLKFKAKNKAATRRREASGTGGGPATLDDVSETDKKILAIIGEGAVYGDTQHRVPIFISPKQDRTESNPLIVEEMETSGGVTDYTEEITINTSESPLPSVSASVQVTSPSTRGHTTRVDTTEATATSPGSPCRPSVPSRQTFESPVSRRQLRQARQKSSSIITRAGRTDQRVEPSWVVELERRRVDAESRLADAAIITAEAARTQAEASRMQAEASRMQAEALRDHAAALHKLIEILSKK